MEVPWRPPSAAVLWPRSEAPVDPSAPLRLWGVATSCDGHPVDDGHSSAESEVVFTVREPRQG